MTSTSDVIGARKEFGFSYLSKHLAGILSARTRDSTSITFVQLRPLSSMTQKFSLFSAPRRTVVMIGIVEFAMFLKQQIVANTLFFTRHFLFLPRLLLWYTKLRRQIDGRRF